MAEEYPLVAFDRPSRIPRAAALHHVWGDSRSQTTMDEIYVSTDTVSQVIFSLGPGARFKDSAVNGTIYPADQIYYVLRGTFAVECPETSEVVCAGPGEAIYFGPDTWHHGYNWGTGRTSVLEFSAPSARESVRYAAERSPPPAARSEPGGPLRWPVEGSSPRAIPALRKLWHLTPRDRFWVVDGEEAHTLTGVLAATHRFTAAELRLPPFHEVEPRRHEGEETGYVVSGMVEIHLSGAHAEAWLELREGDGYYLPAHTEHSYVNADNGLARLLTQVVPGAV